MVSTVQHEGTDTTARPNWPQHAQRHDGVVDVRDDTSLPYAPTENHEHHDRPRRGLRARRMLGWVLAALILGAVAIVAAVNRGGEVGIDMVFDEGSLPLWGIIAGAAALGFGAGRFLDDGC